MLRTVRINIEHVAGDTFRAILFNCEGDDREVFDIIEASEANLPALLRARKKEDGHEWTVEFAAPWKWHPGKACLPDTMAKKAMRSCPTRTDNLQPSDETAV